MSNHDRIMHLCVYLKHDTCVYFTRVLLRVCRFAARGAGPGWRAGLSTCTSRAAPSCANLFHVTRNTKIPTNPECESHNWPGRAPRAACAACGAVRCAACRALRDPQLARAVLPSTVRKSSCGTTPPWPVRIVLCTWLREMSAAPLVTSAATAAARSIFLAPLSSFRKNMPQRDAIMPGPESTIGRATTRSQAVRSRRT